MTQYIGIHSEGGLIPYDVLEKIAKDEPGLGQQPKDFGLAAGRRLTDEIARAWSDAQDYWHIFQRRSASLPDTETGATLTRKWIGDVLELLGYELTLQQAGVVIGGKNYPISHRAGVGEESPPVDIEGFHIDLDYRPQGRRLSPQALVQEYLNNREGHLWGIVTNGLLLRLLRETPRTSRPSFLEFDLQSILDGNRFNEFAIFYRVCHRTRLPKTTEESTSCWLEKYFQLSIEQGGRVRERLRDGVEEALKTLGTGFLRHPANSVLRDRVKAGTLNAPEFHRQMLRLVYRLLFLMVAEERRMIVPEGPEADRRQSLYDRYYSIWRLRTLAEKQIEPSTFGDLWIGLQQTFGLFEDGDSNPLGIPPLNGDLFSTIAVKDLQGTHLYNHLLLAAMERLALFEDHRVRQRVNYSALDVEELGSVYESLLDYQPIFEEDELGLKFRLLEGSERRATGSYYTAPELVRELIESALVPVIQDRLGVVKDIDPLKEKDKKIDAILSISVCDPACGSGHFLLASARRLGRELAKVRTGEDEPTPKEFHLAVREVITSCIYGVDVNPLAVDLCKLALWLEGHWTGKPLSFLDHRIKCGNSLVGVLDAARLEDGIPDDAFSPVTGDDKTVAKAFKKQNRDERRGQPHLPFDAVQHAREYASEYEKFTHITENTPSDVREKSRAYQAWRGRKDWWHDWTACNIWTAAFFSPLTRFDDPTIPTHDRLLRFIKHQDSQAQMAAASNALAERFRWFHWRLEFPEVFEKGGFDLFIGNPPFMGGLKISEQFSPKFRKFLDTVFAPASGKADLCAFFFRRAFQALRKDGQMGFVGTNSIGQGETRETGLAVLVHEGGSIVFAHRFIAWPGAATVEVNLFTLRKGEWKRSVVLDGKSVQFISSRLDEDEETTPFPLSENEALAFQGSIVLGLGFILDPREAEDLLEKNPTNRDCLFPYLNGEDVNTRPDHSPSRWVIQFDERSETEASRYDDLWKIVQERVWPERSIKNGEQYPRMVKEWWKHWNNRQELYRKVRRLSRTLVRSRIGEMHGIVFVPNDWIYNEKVIVFAFEDYFHFGLLQSTVHEIWMRKFTSTLRTDINYAPTDCFETFPFPEESTSSRQQEAIAEEYYRHREGIMLTRQIGLTKLYNLFHESSCNDGDIAKLRTLHRDLDAAITLAYGVPNADIELGYHENERGQNRFTFGSELRRKILRFLLELNLDRTLKRNERATASAVKGIA